MRYLFGASIAYLCGAFLGLSWVVAGIFCLVGYTLWFWTRDPRLEQIASYQVPPIAPLPPRIVEVVGLFDKRSRPRRAVVRREYSGHVEVELIPRVVGDKYTICLPHEYIRRVS